MKLSIITINLNNASGLEKTIQSVVNQTFTDFEYILIDGNSKDESVEIIKKYSSKIYYWVSEPDTGIYNAMNKGIRKAVGDYCLFLNSGDWLISSTTLQDVFNEISNTTPADIFYSDRNNSDGNIIVYPDKLTIDYLFIYGINHQNSLIKRLLFLKHDFYNELLHIVSDQEFFMKEMWIYKSKFTKIKTSISIFDVHGIGSQNFSSIHTENIIAYKNVFQELSESILEIKDYHKTIYYNIIKYYGNTKILEFILKSYRFIIKRIKKIFK